MSVPKVMATISDSNFTFDGEEIGIIIWTGDADKKIVKLEKSFSTRKLYNDLEDHISFLLSKLFDRAKSNSSYKLTLDKLTLILKNIITLRFSFDHLEITHDVMEYSYIINILIPSEFVQNYDKKDVDETIEFLRSLKE